MENMSKYQDYIQPFLDGELSRKELDWISKELESNAVLAEDIKLYREVDQAIKEQDVLDLRNQLDVIHNSLGEKVREPKYVPRYKRALSYAAIASLAVLISIGVVYKINMRKLTNEAIFEKYYEPYEVTMVYRSAETDARNLFTEAMLKYEAEEYETAIGLFQLILDKDPGNMETELYSGISNMEIERYSEANSSFNRIIEQNDNLFVEQAEWSLAFCYLMTDNQQESKDAFMQIANKEGYYREHALKIVKRIK